MLVMEETPSAEEDVMPTVQQVQEALDRRGVPRTSATVEAYHVEAGPGDTVLVRWGYGDPFRGNMMIRGGAKLASCAEPSVMKGSSLTRRNTTIHGGCTSE
jgi:hypothetical protein